MQRRPRAVSNRWVMPLVLHLAITLVCYPLERAHALDSEKAAGAVLQFQRSLLAIEDGQRDSPRDRWDPQYVVDTVGVDPVELFYWVRSEVSWIPYNGMLRGPMGVLMDRRGNSLDASLLLAELAEKAGYEARLAHAQLSAASATAVWRRMAGTQPSPASGRGQNDSSANGLQPETDDQSGIPEAILDLVAQISAEEAERDRSVMDVAARYGFDGANAAKLLAANRGTAAGLREELDSRIADQGAQLLDLLQPPDAARSRANAASSSIAALQDHWWVQVNEGGRWLDFDFLHAGEQPGEALAQATKTYSPQALPPELRHKVTLRQVVEQWRAGTTEERTVLEHELFPSELIGRRITLTHLPLDWPPDWNPSTPEELQVRLFAALRSQRQWLPILEVGTDRYQQFGVYTTGELNESPSPTQNPFYATSVPAIGQVGRVVDVFDDLFQDIDAVNGNAPGEGTVGEEPARDEGELTAEWIEYVIDVPGKPSQVVRRQVFDLIGPAARVAGPPAQLQLSDETRLARAAGLLTDTSIVMLPCRLAPEYLLEMASQNALANRPLLEEFSRDPFSTAPANLIELLARMTPLPGPAYAMASMRFDNSYTAGDVFVDRPMIVAQHSFLVRTKPAYMDVNLALDLVSNGVGVDPLSELDPFDARVLQGVADTNAEALALAGSYPPAQNTAESFARASQEGLAWIPLGAGDRSKLSAIGLAPDLEARVAADLQQGQAVVLPGDAALAGVAGWWRIDPMSGETVGIGPNGWGASLVEYAFVISIQVMMAEIACMAQNAAIEPQISKLTSEKAREKVWAWAKRCVSQALLQTLTGVSSSWMMAGIFPGPGSPGRKSPAGNSGPAIKNPYGNAFNRTQKLPSAGAGATQRIPRAGGGQTQKMSKPGGGQTQSVPNPRGGRTQNIPRPGSEAPPAAGTAGRGPKPSESPAPRGSGPFQGDPEQRDWLRKNWHEDPSQGHPLANALGSPKIYDKADRSASDRYNQARARGLDDQAARQQSHEEWWKTVKDERNARKIYSIPGGGEWVVEPAGGGGSIGLSTPGSAGPGGTGTVNMGSGSPAPAGGNQSPMAVSNAGFAGLGNALESFRR